MGVSGISRADADHDRARQALEAGEVLPLGTILERVERDHPGQVLDVELELEKHDGVERWVYEVKLLRTGRRPGQAQGRCAHWHRDQPQGQGLTWCATASLRNKGQRCAS